MGVDALGSVSNHAIVPSPFALVERYAYLKWFFLLYPIVLITIQQFPKLPEFCLKNFDPVWTFVTGES
jgi:hypothetical protein